MIFIRFFCITMIMLLTACAGTSLKFEGSTEGERLHSFFEWSFNSLLERDPLMLGQLGVKKKQNELNDLSFEFQQETLKILAQHQGILRSFDKTSLSVEDQRLYDIYEWVLKDRLSDETWRDYAYIVNTMRGVQSAIPSYMIQVHQVQSVEDLRNYVDRLLQFKLFYSQAVNQLMRSEQKGVILPQFLFDKVIADSANIITGKPFEESGTDSPLWADFKNKLQSLNLSSEQEKQWNERGREAFRKSVWPGYQQLILFLKAQKLRAPQDAGVWRFAKGDLYYRMLLKKMTTLELSPEEIHQLGLNEVQRIHKEMRLLQKKMGIPGKIQNLFVWAKQPQHFYPNTKNGRQSYLRLAQNWIDGIRPQVPNWLGKLPQANLVVLPVESFREKSAGLASYLTPSLDGKRPGIYYVNLSNMKALPRWESEALAYHEAIPGHHLQLALSQENKTIPRFQKHSRFAAWSEGWGLYAEKFPKEFGFYKDTSSDFGRLSLELRRACRLVVDTGLHSLKWSREKAIDYLNQNSPGDVEDHGRQIDRYTVMPGQATAYTIGLHKILQMRQYGEKQLGKKFSLKDFHDFIIGSGPMPLELLEKKWQAQSQELLKQKRQ